MRTGRPLPRPRRRRQVSRPSIRGISRSSTTASTPPLPRRSSASAPSAARSTSYPSKTSDRSSDSRTAGSSSTTRILGIGRFSMFAPSAAGGTRGRGDPQGLLEDVADDGDLGRGADRGGPPGRDQVVPAPDGDASELHDQVALAQPGLGGWATRYDAGDERAGVAAQPVSLGLLRGDPGRALDPEERRLDGPPGDDPLGDLERLVGRDREPDPGVAARAAGDGGVDPDDLPGRVGEGATGVARVDRGVGLDGSGDLLGGAALLAARAD